MDGSAETRIFVFAIDKDGKLTRQPKLEDSKDQSPKMAQERVFRLSLKTEIANGNYIFLEGLQLTEERG